MNTSNMKRGSKSELILRLAKSLKEMPLWLNTKHIAHDIPLSLHSEYKCKPGSTRQTHVEVNEAQVYR